MCCYSHRQNNRTVHRQNNRTVHRQNNCTVHRQNNRTVHRQNNSHPHNSNLLHARILDCFYPHQIDVAELVNRLGEESKHLDEYVNSQSVIPPHGNCWGRNKTFAWTSSMIPGRKHLDEYVNNRSVASPHGTCWGRNKHLHEQVQQSQANFPICTLSAVHKPWTHRIQCHRQV